MTAGRVSSATTASASRPFAAWSTRSPTRHSSAAGRLGRDLVTLTVEHLVLVGASLAVAIAVGLPLGLFAARHRFLGQIELMGIGVLQTVPALALLAFMIPLFGIGRVPALVALCL